MKDKIHIFLILTLRQFPQHLSAFILSTLLLFLLISVILIGDSLRYALLTYNNNADITLQRYENAQIKEIPPQWIDEILEIPGVKSVQGRVVGRYFYEPKEHSFTILGIDFYDTQIQHALAPIVHNLDLNTFLAQPHMLIGAGVARFFKERAYEKYYIFRPPNRSKQKVYIFDTLAKNSALYTNDLIIVDIDTARKILGVPKGHYNEILIELHNPHEYTNVYNQLLIAHFNTRIVTAEELHRYYENLFNYTGGFFLSLYSVLLLGMMLIIYDRYRYSSTEILKEIYILRSLGMSIQSLISFKIIQNLLILFIAFITASIMAMVYVFYLDAPLMKDIFLGNDNLDTSAISFVHHIDVFHIFLAALLFGIPFLLASLIPLWKNISKEIEELLK